jgi:hypothetical protein
VAQLASAKVTAIDKIGRVARIVVLQWRPALYDFEGLRRFLSIRSR